MKQFKQFLQEKIMIFMPIALLLLVATGILLYQNNTQNRSLESKDVALENLQQELTAKDTEIKALTQSDRKSVV